MTERICAVTGAAGYVGGALCRFLEGKGWTVRRLGRPGRSEQSGQRPGLDFSFTLGEETDPAAFRGASALVHAAYDFGCRDAVTARRVNVEGTRRLLAQAREAGIDRVALVSTMSAYAGCRSVYGRTKLEMERLVAGSGAVVRPGLVHGPRPGGMLGRLAAQVEGGRPLPLVGGDKALCMVHEDDLGALVARCLEERLFSPPVYTAAHPRPWTLREILEALAVARGTSCRFVPLPWQPVWLALRTAEALGVRLGFRSDSLLGLAYADPAPDFDVAAALVPFRAFTPGPDGSC